MATPQTTPPSLAVVVAAGQGCVHAAAVIEGVRAQLSDADELIVAEPDPCTVGGLLPTESHRAVGALADDEIHLWGMGVTHADVVIQLEDHGVPAPGLFDVVRSHFQQHPALEAQTFWLRNGTPESIGSRVLFSYVGGLAEAGARRPLPYPVCSSYAIRRTAFERLRDAGVIRHAGDLEYRVVPELANAGLDSLPAAGCLVHFQQNTVRQAWSAVHWNARAAGHMERDRPMDGRTLVIARRYFGHVVRLQQERRRPVGELALLAGCGVAGFTGWWTGRLRGPGAAVAMLKSVHPVAAEAPAAPSLGLPSR